MIGSLKVYVIVAQDKRHLTVLRRGRGTGWKTETVEGRGGILTVPELRVEIPLARIYERTSVARRAG